MGQREGLGFNSLGVARQPRESPDFAGLVALVAGEEELTGKYFVDQSTLVGGRPIGSNAHGFEVRDGDRDDMAVEAEDDAAQQDGFGAEGGEVVGDGAVWSEVGGTETEVHEDPVGDGGVGWLRRGGREGRDSCDGGGDGKRGGEEDGTARKVGSGGEVFMVMGEDWWSTGRYGDVARHAPVAPGAQSIVFGPLGLWITQKKGETRNATSGHRDWCGSHFFLWIAVFPLANFPLTNIAFHCFLCTVL